MSDYAKGQGELSPYYLPVTQPVAEAFVTHGTMPSLPIERAAAFAMLSALQAPHPGHSSLARLLVGADEAFGARSGTQDEAAAYLVARREDIIGRNFADLVTQLERNGVVFATEDQFESRTWCGGNGRYTEAFQQYCRSPLIDYEIDVDSEDEDGDEEDRRAARRLTLHGTADQARTARAISVDRMEHFAVDAYAGSGKTHLLFALVEAGGRYTHLAPSEAHQYAFMRRRGSAAIQSVRQKELAEKMISTHLLPQLRRGQWAPAAWPSKRSPEEQAAIAGITPLGHRNPTEVLERAYSALQRWSASDRPALSAKDFRGATTDDTIVQQIAVASNLWELMFQPRRDRFQDFTVTTSNIVKWLDLHGASIPDLGTLLIDEGHDLSPAWRSLLSRYKRGVVLMGDPYQTGGNHVARRDEHAKWMVMHHSVRTGEQAMPLIRSVLDTHSESLMSVPLIGSRDRITQQRQYQKAAELPEHGLHIYGSEWRLLEDALRLKHAGTAFAVLDASAKQITRAVDHAVSLKRGDYPRHRVRSLSRFHNWEELKAHLVESKQERVLRLFERGFRRDDVVALWTAALSPDDASISLGLLGHCKNLEASIVTLSECCFVDQMAAKQGRPNDEQVKDLYVAMTRVRNQLWVPPAAIEQFQHYSRTSDRRRLTSREGSMDVVPLVSADQK